MANEGNSFWTRRSKHGRDYYFKSPEELFDRACEYFEDVEQSPYIVVEQKKGQIMLPRLYGADKEDNDGYLQALQGVLNNAVVEMPLAKPFTLLGLCRFLGCSSGYFRAFKVTQANGSENETKEHKRIREDFLAIITQVEEIIEDQQFSGAAAGIFKENIISRKLGLIDKQAIEGDIKLGVDAFEPEYV